jgi:hypothetical protein
MYLTEDEAKQKACCKVMPHKEDGKLVTAVCLASVCMAWRWTDPDARHGYCGLAGKP